MRRITNSDLEQLVRILNKRTGHKEEPYTKENGKFKPNPGNYHLDGAYGATGLAQMCKHGTGTRYIFYKTTKRDLYNRIYALIDGIEIGKEVGRNELDCLEED